MLTNNYSDQNASGDYIDAEKACQARANVLCYREGLILTVDLLYKYFTG